MKFIFYILLCSVERMLKVNYLFQYPVFRFSSPTLKEHHVQQILCQLVINCSTSVCGNERVYRNVAGIILLTNYIYIYTYSFTDPSSAQVGIIFELFMKRAKISICNKVNQ